MVRRSISLGACHRARETALQDLDVPPHSVTPGARCPLSRGPAAGRVLLQPPSCPIQYVPVQRAAPKTEALLPSRFFLVGGAGRHSRPGTVFSPGALIKFSKSGARSAGQWQAMRGSGGRRMGHREGRRGAAWAGMLKRKGVCTRPRACARN